MGEAAKRRVPELAARVAERRAAVDDVAFTLEPDLKEGRGGLRDVHSLQWLEAAQPALAPGDAHELAEAYEVLLAAASSCNGSPADRATWSHCRTKTCWPSYSATSMPTRSWVASPAQRGTITWIGDDVWERVTQPERGRIGGRAPRAVALGPGITFRGHRVYVDPDRLPRNDPSLALRVANLAIEQAATIDRDRTGRRVGALGITRTAFGPTTPASCSCRCC